VGTRGSAGRNQRQNRSTGAVPTHVVQSPVTTQDKTPAEKVGNYHSDVLLLHGCPEADEIPLEGVSSCVGSPSVAAAARAYNS